MSLLDRILRRPADAELAATPQPIFEDPTITADHLKVGQFEERGATGSVWLSGILVNEEYNPDLTGERALRTYDKMYRSEAQIGALFSVMLLPLLQAKWEIVAASESAEDKKIAQHVQDNLFGGMRQTWQDHLNFSLRGQLRDGFAVEEIVYELGPDGMIRVKKLAPRLSKTIYRVYPNDDDELDRIQQRVWKPNPDGIGGYYEYPMIPGSKLLWHAYRREGNNWFGLSMLRQMYQNWYYKQALLKIAAVAAERMAVGVPVFKEPQSPQPNDRTKAAQVLQSLHAYQKTYVLEPFGWEFRFETPNATKAMNLLPLIEYHDLQMARSCLAQFLQLDAGGSFAMMKDISSFFLQALHSLAKDEEDLHNAKLIRPLVDLNFKTARYPTLNCTEIDKRSLDDALEGIAKMFDAGAITKTPTTENAIRSMIDLPDLDEKELAAIRQQALDDQKAMADMAAPLRTESGGPGASRSDQEAPDQPSKGEEPLEPKPDEAKLADETVTGRIDMAPIHAALDDGEARMRQDARPILDRQIDALVGQVRQSQDAASLTVPYEDQMERAFVGIMRAQYHAGHQLISAQAMAGKTARLADDPSDDGDEPDPGESPTELQNSLIDRAKALVTALGLSLVAAVESAAKELGVTASAEDLRTAATRAIGRTWSDTVGRVVGASFASGRSAGARRHGAVKATYEAVDDKRTCGPCGDLDGAEFSVGSAEYLEVQPPNPECFGGLRCRCQMFYEFD